MTSIGPFEAPDGRRRIVEQAEGEPCRRFVFHDGLLAGVVRLGDTCLAAAANRAIEQRRDFSLLLNGLPDTQAIVETLA